MQPNRACANIVTGTCFHDAASFVPTDTNDQVVLLDGRLSGLREEVPCAQLA